MNAADAANANFAAKDQSDSKRSNTALHLSDNIFHITHVACSQHLI
jgi:hypothetical protein